MTHEDEQDAYRLDAQLLSDLWIFRTAARFESFTAAAPRLGVTQSAVSQRVLRLEARLGTPLFVRHKSRLALTDAGRTLFDSMSQVASVLNDSLSRINRLERQAIVVRCVPSLAIEWLVPHLEDFYRLHPGITVFVRSELAPSTAASMEDDGVDLVIDYQILPPTDLQALAGLQELMFPVCSRRYREMMEGPDGETARLVFIHDTDPADLEWGAWFAVSGSNWPGRPVEKRHFNLAHLAYHAALCDQGIAIGHSVIANRLLIKGELVPALDASPVPGATYRVCTNRPGDARSPVRLFAKWWQEAMAETQRQTLALFVASDETAD